MDPFLAKVEALEWDLLSNKAVSGKQTTAILVSNVVNGQYKRVLTSNEVRHFLGTDISEDSSAEKNLADTLDLRKYISNRMELYLGNSPEFQRENQLLRQLRVLCVAAACLNAFVQAAWTGPAFDLMPEDLLPRIVRSVGDELKAKVLKELSVDGENVYHLTPSALFLLIARCILVDNLDRLNGLKTTQWWGQRALFVQQRLLDNPAGSLHGLMFDYFTSIESKLPPFTPDTSEIHVHFNLEYGLLHHYYQKDTLAIARFLKAQEYSGLKWKLTGALGKRTKFQTFDVSQLLLVANSIDVENRGQQVDSKSAMPNDVSLNDDTLLENIELTKTNDNQRDETEIDLENQGSLKTIDQCLLLAFCLNVKNTNPAHGITNEQMEPYVARVLENPNNWMVHTMGLLLRSRLEKEKTRTVERSALQLQALVDQFSIEMSSAQERIQYFYVMLLPSKWEMERELAERFISLGVIRSALQIFERLEMWEDIITCYIMLEKHKTATEIIIDRLNMTPDSPILYCLLGDVEQNPINWERAWELSGHKFARAMRSLGGYWFKKEEYSKCVECYKEALKINPLSDKSWFIQGCAAMRISDWVTAAESFVRAISIDPENGEAWNNLGSVLIKQNRKREAFNALQQGLKQRYDSWKMWTNYMYVAIDIRDFAEAIRAMQRVVELQWEKIGDHSVDLEVLEIIVNSVTRGVKDADNEDTSRLAPKLEHLLSDTITAHMTSNPKIWALCGKFWFWQKVYDKALEAHLKAWRAVSKNEKLTYSVLTFNEVARVALDLAEMYQNVGPLIYEKEIEEELEDGRTRVIRVEEIVCKDWLRQATKVLSGLIKTTEDYFEGTEMHDKLLNTLKDLNQLKEE
ncbi:473_t:CDS:1 [Paraglomus brasilianum]|uniref:473_t:CDS:1 n=1 Tax=Paraglomus brasilianum TaxID=144538 RepID=A0A9N9BXV8_9GLOM|nr:473_t:CDS:1 [Paraglomus brasilianum]